MKIFCNVIKYLGIVIIFLVIFVFIAFYSKTKLSRFYDRTCSSNRDCEIIDVNSYYYSPERIAIRKDVFFNKLLNVLDRIIMLPTVFMRPLYAMIISSPTSPYFNFSTNAICNNKQCAVENKVQVDCYGACFDSPDTKPFLESYNKYCLPCNFITGEIKPINKDLDLINYSTFSPESKYKDIYYEAGILGGAYEGYKRILLVINSYYGPIDPTSLLFVLITPDDKTYYYVSDTKTNGLPQLLNSTKVALLDNLSINTFFPEKISLDDHFSLYRLKPHLIVEENQLLETSKYNHVRIQINPAISYTSYLSLKTVNPNYKFYSAPNKSEVIVADSTGFSYEYKLVLNNLNNDRYLNFHDQDVTTSDSIYGEYSDSFNQFGISYSMIDMEFVSINLTDLRKIGLLTDIPIYVFKDNNQSAYQKAFEIRKYDLERKNVNYSDYISKYPVVFMQDYWKRWLMIYENSMALSRIKGIF